MRADSTLRSSRWDPPVVLASLGANLLSLVVPMSMIHLYDRIIPNHGFETLVVLGIIVLCALVAEVVLRSARRFLLERAGETFELAVYGAAFNAIVNAEPSHGDKLSRGRLISSVNAIERLRNIHTGETALAILDLPFACLFLAVVILISPLAGAAVAGILVTTFIVLRIARARTFSIQNKRREIEERRYSFLAEVFGGIESIKNLHIEDAMRRRYERLMGASAEVGADAVRVTHFAQGFTATIGAFAPILVACVGAVLAIDGQMTVGAMAAVILLTGRIIQPALRVEAFLAGISATEMERSDLEEVLAMPLMRAGLKELPEVSQVEMAGVSTLPQSGGSFHFKDVDLKLERGDCVAITGPSRLACSSFLEMFLGELEISGDFRLNGEAFDAFALADRCQKIRLLSHENNLLPGTLMDNLTRFQGDAFLDEAMELSGKLGLDAAIATTQQGYHVKVGQTGNSGLTKSFSDIATIIGGLACKPDFLLFDRANATLDQETDRRLLSILQASIPERITLICSDRPSYLKLAQRTIDVTQFQYFPASVG